MIKINAINAIKIHLGIQNIDLLINLKIIIKSIKSKNTLEINHIDS